MNKVFLDTNLIVYANDARDAQKLYATVHVENPFAAPPKKKK